MSPDANSLSRSLQLIALLIGPLITPLITWGICALLVTSLPANAAHAANADTDAIELQQHDGSIVSLNSPASRIVSLSPHLTELVFAAGAGDRLAATVEYSEYPPEAIDLPRVGDAFRIDIEQVHLLSPDLVLAWQSGNPAAAIAQLDELGFNVWRIEIREPDQIADIIENIGKAAGTESVASAVAGNIRLKINALEAQHQSLGKIPYFYQVAAQPLYTVSGEHLISHGLSLCGGQNVFADLATLAPQVGLEAVLTADPQLLIGPDIDGQDDPLAHWHSWPRIEAVRDENYLLLPADAISRATPRFIDAIELACTMMDELRKQ